MNSGKNFAARSVTALAVVALIASGFVPGSWATAEDDPGSAAAAAVSAEFSVAAVEPAAAAPAESFDLKPELVPAAGEPEATPASSGGSTFTGVASAPDEEDAPLFVQDSTAVETATADLGAPVLLLATTSTWRSPDDAGERPGPGSIHWHDEHYARESGNRYAWAELNDNQVTEYLEVHDFGFSLPTGATVTGIEVDIERQASDVHHFSPLRDYVVKLVRDGDVVGENRATDTNYPEHDAYENHGSATDLWGETWTAADVNGHGFGVVLAVKKFGSQGGRLYALVDHIRVKVTYSVNQAPDAFHRHSDTYMNLPIWNTLLGRDRDSEPLTFEVLDDVDHGTFTLADHVTTTHWVSWLWGKYRPDRNFVGTDVLTYRVTDPHGATATETAEFVVHDADFDFFVDGVVATPPPGTYAGTQMVTLTANTSTTPWGDVQIWYTKDGSEPACGTGAQYSSPISVPVDLTIRAVACYPFEYTSDESSFPYTITEAPSGNGGGAPLPGGPGLLPPVFEPTPAVLGAATVNPVVARVLGAATCLSKLDDPMGVVRPDDRLAKKLAGRILLKVQACGEAWYLNPLTLRRHRLPADQSLLDVVRSLAIKASDDQLKSVTVGDLGNRRGSSKAPASLTGRFLQAGDGSLWYVNPADGRRYDVSSVEKMLNVMRKLGAGISNANIAKILVAK